MQKQQVNHISEIIFVLHCEEGRNSEFVDLFISILGANNLDSDVELFIVKTHILLLPLDHVVCP